MTLQWQSVMSDSASASPEEVLLLEGLHKTYNAGTPLELEVLHGISMRLHRGELTSLIGPSGSGKSTLLNVIGLLDSPSKGELYLMGKPTRQMDDEQRTALRNERIGFVFQFHHLITAFTVLENVLMPLMIHKGKPSPADTERAMALLEAIGMQDFAQKKANAISGGQQQRVAIARALITRPALILADEPTGNLDTRTADSVFDLFRRFNDEFGCAVLVVTHDPRLSARCQRTIELLDGTIVRDELNPPS